jgi:hypothetical protein
VLLQVVTFDLYQERLIGFRGMEEIPSLATP